MSGAKQAINRLTRDLLEWERAHIPSISATPISSDIFEWHVNIHPVTGVYCGIHFHLIINFNLTYPKTPPIIKICTPIKHPNISQKHLCLAMLRRRQNINNSRGGSVHHSALNSHQRPSGGGRGRVGRGGGGGGGGGLCIKPFDGWSVTYTVTSILMQLQSFLCPENTANYNTGRGSGGGGAGSGGGANRNGSASASSSAAVTEYDVTQAIQFCKEFKCVHPECNHTHMSPFPKIKSPASMIRVQPLSPETFVQGSVCQTTHTYWVGAYGEIGVNTEDHKVMYEVYINWVGDTWTHRNIKGGLCRFGWGTKFASVCGKDENSFGYGGTGKFSYNSSFEDFGKSFSVGDTITCAINFTNYRIYFAKNGRVIEPEYSRFIPQRLVQDVLNENDFLYPMLSFKNSRAQFNFGTPHKPCHFLIQNGFETLEVTHKRKQLQRELVLEQTQKQRAKEEAEQAQAQGQGQGQGQAQAQQPKGSNFFLFQSMRVPTVWVSIFVKLALIDLNRCRFVCKNWTFVLDKYNLRHRTQSIACFYCKRRFIDNHFESVANQGTAQNSVIFGMGVNIKSSDFGCLVVGDCLHGFSYLSLGAWNFSYVRKGIWGQTLTHFLPLVINSAHASIAYLQIMRHLQTLTQLNYSSNPAVLKMNENLIKKSVLIQEILMSEILQAFDTIISMMDSIVIQFAKYVSNKANPKITLKLCESALFGYCSLYHMLLYLMSCYYLEIQPFVDKTVRSFAECINTNNNRVKFITPNLGKFLIYVLMSDNYEYSDIAIYFVYELLVRGVSKFAKDFPQLNTTQFVQKRLLFTHTANKAAYIQAVFQLYFMQLIFGTLKSYNNRCGVHPIHYAKQLHRYVQKTIGVRNHSNNNSGKDGGGSIRNMSQFLGEMKIAYLSNETIDRLLRWAVYESLRTKYHLNAGGFGRKQKNVIEQMNCPVIQFNGGDDGSGGRDTNHGNKNTVRRRKQTFYNNAKDNSYVRAKVQQQRRKLQQRQQQLRQLRQLQQQQQLRQQQQQQQSPEQTHQNNNNNNNGNYSHNRVQQQPQQQGQEQGQQYQSASQNQTQSQSQDQGQGQNQNQNQYQNQGQAQSEEQEQQNEQQSGAQSENGGRNQNYNYHDNDSNHSDHSSDDSTSNHSKQHGGIAIQKDDAWEAMATQNHSEHDSEEDSNHNNNSHSNDNQNDSEDGYNDGSTHDSDRNNADTHGKGNGNGNDSVGDDYGGREPGQAPQQQQRRGPQNNNFTRAPAQTQTGQQQQRSGNSGGGRPQQSQGQGQEPGQRRRQGRVRGRGRQQQSSNNFVNRSNNRGQSGNNNNNNANFRPQSRSQQQQQHQQSRPRQARSRATPNAKYSVPQPMRRVQQRQNQNQNQNQNGNRNRNNNNNNTNYNNQNWSQNQARSRFSGANNFNNNYNNNNNNRNFRDRSSGQFAGSRNFENRRNNGNNNNNNMGYQTRGFNRNWNNNNNNPSANDGNYNNRGRNANANANANTNANANDNNNAYVGQSQQQQQALPLSKSAKRKERRRRIHAQAAQQRQQRQQNY